MNSARWTWFAIGYQCLFAYVIAFMIHQFGSALTGNQNGIGLTAAVAVFAFIVYMLFRPCKEAKKLTRAVRVTQ